MRGTACEGGVMYARRTVHSISTALFRRKTWTLKGQINAEEKRSHPTRLLARQYILLWEIRSSVRASCAVRNLHPISESRDLSMDRDLSTRLHRFARRSKTLPRRKCSRKFEECRTREGTKGDNAECGNSSWRMILCFVFRRCEIYHEKKYRKHIYRFRRIFDTVFTRNTKYPRGDRKELERKRKNILFSHMKV